MLIKFRTFWTSLVVQRLTLYVPSARDPGLIPDQGTKSHISQLRAHMSQLKKKIGNLEHG